jgi:hypothetical protein
MRFFRLLMCASVVTACQACTQSATSASKADAVAAPITVKQVLEHSADWEGKVFTVTGQFAGWTGGCKGMPPRTRSDWMLVDGADCVYVSGPLPAGVVAPPDTASNGKVLALRVKAERHMETKKIYLLNLYK